MMHARKCGVEGLQTPVARLLVLTTLWMVVSSASAVVIPIVNGDFEDGEAYPQPIEGWSLNHKNGIGKFAMFEIAAAPNGSSHALIFNHKVSSQVCRQAIDPVYRFHEGCTYTLSGDFCNGTADGEWQGIYCVIWAHKRGETSRVALKINITPEMFSGKNEWISVTDSVTADASLNGWTMDVMIQVLGGRQPFADNIRLAMQLPDSGEINLGDDLDYLVKDGRANYPIVLAATAALPEWTAARELADHLQAISGASFPILLAEEYSSGPMIAVGFNNRLSLQRDDPRLADLADDELLILPDKDVLLLTGGNGRGTLYAVYEFLNRLGVRWYTPEYTKIPRLSSIPMPKDAYRFRPPLKMRTVIVGNNTTTAWQARNRHTTYRFFGVLGAEYGCPSNQGPDMHTFGRLVRKSELQHHPEWLAELNGKRTEPVGHTWSLCLSRKDVREFLIARTLAYARKHPATKTVWIGQNDGSQCCACADCRAFHRAHGDQPSASIVRLVNELADAMADEMPDRMVKTLAYSWSLMPPEGMTLRDNVIIMFCAGGSFFHPIASDPGREDLRRAMDQWSHMTDHIDVYLYSAPFDNYWFPAPCTYSGAKNIQWCASHGANRLYSCISGWANWYGSEWMNLRAWVYSRLMWDPSLDIHRLVEEFVVDYYGPAAPAVFEAIALTHSDVFDDAGALAQRHDSPIVPAYVNPQVVRTVNELFERTHAELTDDTYRRRLRFAWIPYLWGDFWLGFRQAGQYAPDTSTWSVPMADGARRNRYGKLVTEFLCEHKVNALRELVQLKPETLALDRMGIPLPAPRVTDGDVHAVVVPDIAGQIVEFSDRRLAFRPLKPYWGFLILQYPLYGAWRDYVNNSFAPQYHLKESDAKRVLLTADVANCAVEKNVWMADGVLHTELIARARQEQKTVLRVSPMFDMNAEGFGVYPTIYVEKQDGSWSERVLGTETDFWYIAGKIDISGSTGRMVLAAEHRPEGVLMTFDPQQVAHVGFEYDRFDNYPEDQAHMVRIEPASVPHTKAGATARLSLTLEILPSARTFVGRSSAPEKD